MKIPKIVQNILADKRNLYLLVMYLAPQHKKLEDAYDEAIDYVRKYAPFFKPYKNYESYLSSMKKNLNSLILDECIEVPEVVIKSVTKGIGDLMHINLKKYKVRKFAYDATIVQITKHFAPYKPYKNYQSYKAVQTYRQKKKKLK